MARVQAREVRERLQGKVHPELVDIICSMAERQQVQHEQMMSVAEAVNKLMDQFTDVVMASGRIADGQKKLAKKLGFGTDVKSMVESFNEKDDDTGSTR